MKILIICLIYCVILTLIMFIQRRNKIFFLFLYPPEIKKTAYSLKLVTDLKRIDLYGIIYNLLIALIYIFSTFLYLKIIAKTDDFIIFFIQSYIIWTVCTLYKLIISCLWFCNDERFIIKGTEDLNMIYKSKSYHFLKFIRSTAFGVIISLLCASVSTL